MIALQGSVIRIGEFCGALRVGSSAPMRQS